MGTFNALGGRAFTLPQKKEIPHQVIPEEWLEQLFKQLDEYLDASQQGIIKEYYQTRHLQTYSQRGEINNALSIIYQKWFPLESNALSRDEKKSIAEKILEAAPVCSEGAHDRVNEIITPWQYEWSLDTLLHQYRQTIISAAAYSRTNEVHAHNRFFLLAQLEGLGVQANNPFDPHLGAIPDEVITSLIKETIKQQYHPLNILSFLVDEIKRECLTRYGYHGLCREGYQFGDYKAWFNLVIAPLLERDLDYALLLVSEDDKIIDMDWTRVSLHLIDKLQENNSFNLEDQTLSALLYLMDREQPINKDFDLIGLQDLPNPSENFPLLFNFISTKEKKHQLFELYNNLCIPQARDEKKRLSMLAKVYFNDGIKKEKKLKRNIKSQFNGLMSSVLKTQSPVCFLEKFIYFPTQTTHFKDYLVTLKLTKLVQKKEILKASIEEWNIATYTAHHYPELFSNILELLKTLPINDQEEILFKIDGGKRSVFNLRPRCNPKIIDQITQYVTSFCPFEKQIEWCSIHDGAFLSLLKKYDQIDINPIQVTQAILEFLPDNTKISRALSALYQSNMLKGNPSIKKWVKDLFSFIASSPLHKGDTQSFLRMFHRNRNSPELFQEYLGYLQLMNHKQKSNILKAKYVKCSIILLTINVYPNYFNQLLEIIETLEPAIQEELFLQKIGKKTPVLLTKQFINKEQPALYQTLAKLSGAFQANLFINLNDFFWKYILSDATPVDVIDKALAHLDSKNELAITLTNHLLQIINRPKSPLTHEKKQAVLCVIYKKQPQVLLQELDLFSRPQENQSILINFYQHLKANFDLWPQNESPMNVDQTFFSLSKILKLEADKIKNQKSLQMRRFGLFSKSTQTLNAEILEATKEQREIFQHQ